MVKINNIPAKTKSFLKEVYLELRKVSWLSRRELFKYTVVVILLTLITAAFLGGLDYIFTTLLKSFILR